MYFDVDKLPKPPADKHYEYKVIEGLFDTYNHEKKYNRIPEVSELYCNKAWFNRETDEGWAGLAEFNKKIGWDFQPGALKGEELCGYMHKVFKNGFKKYLDMGLISYYRTDEKGMRYYLIEPKVIEVYHQKYDEHYKWLMGEVEKIKRAEIQQAIKESGAQPTTSPYGIQAKYTNPKCYSDDPGIPPRSANDAIRNLILTPFLLILKGGIGFVILLWFCWLVQLKKNRDQVRGTWEWYSK